MLDSAKIALRRHAPALAYFLKTVLRGPLGASRSSEATFSDIYARGTWGDGDTEPNSGSGSDDAVSAPFVEVMRRLIVEKAITSVVDLGCGDFRVGRQLGDLPVDYTGIDVVPMIVARNNAAYGSAAVRFVCKDITRDLLPPAELCVVRQVLQHLSNTQIKMVLGKLASYRYALVAEHHPARLYRPNLDKDTGADTRIDFDSGVYLEHPPFSAPNVRLIASTPLPALLREGETLAIYLIQNE